MQGAVAQPTNTVAVARQTAASLFEYIMIHHGDAFRKAVRSLPTHHTAIDAGPINVIREGYMTLPGTAAAVQHVHPVVWVELTPAAIEVYREPGHYGSQTAARAGGPKGSPPSFELAFRRELSEVESIKGWGGRSALVPLSDPPRHALHGGC